MRETSLIGSLALKKALDREKDSFPIVRGSQAETNRLTVGSLIATFQPHAKKKRKLTFKVYIYIRHYYKLPNTTRQ